MGECSWCGRNDCSGCHGGLTEQPCSKCGTVVAWGKAVPVVCNNCERWADKRQAAHEAREDIRCVARMAMSRLGDGDYPLATEEAITLFRTIKAALKETP